MVRRLSMEFRFQFENVDNFRCFSSLANYWLEVDTMVENYRSHELISLMSTIAPKKAL